MCSNRHPGSEHNAPTTYIYLVISFLTYITIVIIKKREVSVFGIGVFLRVQIHELGIGPDIGASLSRMVQYISAASSGRAIGQHASSFIRDVRRLTPPFFPPPTTPILVAHIHWARPIRCQSRTDTHTLTPVVVWSCMLWCCHPPPSPSPPCCLYVLSIRGIISLLLPASYVVYAGTDWE